MLHHKIPAAWTRAGLPTELSRQLLSHGFLRTPAIEAVEQYAPLQPSYSVVLQNETEKTGKSVAGAYWLAERIRQSEVICMAKLYVSAKSLAETITRGEKRVLEGISNAPFLFVEDLGGEISSVTPEELLIVGRVLSERIESGVPTFACTSLSPMAIVDHYGARLWRAIRYHASWTVFGTEKTRRVLSGQIEPGEEKRRW